jgi:uncharacterized protein
LTTYFFDSSTLVKRYIVEKGTPWVRSIVAVRSSNRVIIAQITPAEVIISAVSRLVRNQLVDNRSALAIRAYLNRHSEREYIVVNLSKSVLLNAQDLLLKYPLRAYDAVQLASALDTNTRLVAANQPPPVFVCADNRLLTAATSEGLQTHNPV